MTSNTIKLSTDPNSLSAASAELAYNTVDKEYVALWRFQGEQGTDLALQRFSSDGNLIGDSIKVPENENSINEPDITYNNRDNQYLVSFANSDFDFDKEFLFGQLLTANGVPIRNNQIINDDIFEPSFVYNSSQNEYLQTSRRFPGGNAIFAQRIDNNAVPIGSDTRIDSTGDSAPNGEVAFNNIDNQYLATWRNQDGDPDIIGRLISADGSFASNQFNIQEDVGLALAINTVFDPVNTQYLVAYGNRNDSDVSAQLVDADGTLIGNEIVIIDNGFDGGGLTDSISVAFSEDLKIYLLVASTTSGLLGQFINEDGTLIDESFVISPNTNTFHSSVVYNPDEAQFAVSWNFNSSNEGIFAQFIHPPANTINGTSGNDFLVGTPESDRINGFDGNDTIFAKDSDDTLLGGNGQDYLFGGKGDDLLNGGANNDILFGGEGKDRFVVKQGNGLDTIFDYQDGTDSIFLDDGLEFTDLIIAQTFAGTTISLAETSEKLASLINVNVDNITVEDFSTFV